MTDDHSGAGGADGDHTGAGGADGDHTGAGGADGDHTGAGGVAFDHAGIATDDADGLADLYVDLLGCERAHEETFEGMYVTFLDFGNGYVELLEPQEGGTIARYLDEQGPGIHHLAVATDDIEAALDRARTCGVDLVDEQPRQGAWGHEVAFLHPRSTGGVLLEFVQH
jgi:methylmalonyl-CoA/ethylmalonyl-CoA epimerase